MTRFWRGIATGRPMSHALSSSARTVIARCGFASLRAASACWETGWPACPGSWTSRGWLVVGICSTGDIDASDFEILVTYRDGGLEVESVLMDKKAYMRYWRFGTDVDARGRRLKGKDALALGGSRPRKTSSTSPCARPTTEGLAVSSRRGSRLTSRVPSSDAASHVARAARGDSRRPRAQARLSCGLATGRCHCGRGIDKTREPQRVLGGPSPQGVALRELATEGLVERAAVLPCHRGHDGEVLLSRCPSTREGVHRLEGPCEG